MKKEKEKLSEGTQVRSEDQTEEGRVMGAQPSKVRRTSGDKCTRRPA